MGHEILYWKADRTARGVQEGSPLQLKFEASKEWTRVHKSIEERKEQWLEKTAEKPVVKAVAKKKTSKRRSKKK